MGKPRLCRGFFDFLNSDYFQYFNRNRRKDFSQMAQLIFRSRHAELVSASPCFQGIAGQARNDAVWDVPRLALLRQTRRFAPTWGYLRFTLCCVLLALADFLSYHVSVLRV